MCHDHWQLNWITWIATKSWCFCQSLSDSATNRLGFQWYWNSLTDICFFFLATTLRRVILKLLKITTTESSVWHGPNNVCQMFWLFVVLPYFYVPFFFFFLKSLILPKFCELSCWRAIRYRCTCIENESGHLVYKKHSITQFFIFYFFYMFCIVSVVVCIFFYSTEGHSFFKDELQAGITNTLTYLKSLNILYRLLLSYSWPTTNRFFHP